MRKCSQTNCGAEADFSYTWPGVEERVYACATHLKRAATIATAVGFPLGDLRSERDIDDVAEDYDGESS